VLHPKISIEEKGGDVHTKLRANLRQLDGGYVKCGWPEGAKTQPGEKTFTGKYGGKRRFQVQTREDMSDVAKVAAWNEFGVPKTQAGTMRGIMTGRSASPWAIPPRPAFRTAVDGNREQLKEFKAKVFEDIMLGRLTPKQGLDRIGLFMQGKIRESIRHGQWQPNAESTKRAKHSSKPLIDTGQEINSVTWANSLDGK